MKLFGNINRQILRWFLSHIDISIQLYRQLNPIKLDKPIALDLQSSSLHRFPHPCVIHLSDLPCVLDLQSDSVYIININININIFLN